MERQINLKEISDGKLYTLHDMVRADCGSCSGCSACCQGMGNSILLDPLDIHRLCGGLGRRFEELLADSVELNVVEGIILPNLKMAGEQERCAFLNADGRCSVHLFRPGICRIFPLGRFYENGGFQYFLQTGECRKENRAKVKVRKWIDTQDGRANERFIAAWHYFVKAVSHMLENAGNETLAKDVNLYLLNRFYREPFAERQDFYLQFEERLKEAKQYCNLPG